MTNPTATEIIDAFNRDHPVGTHVQYWGGSRTGRGKFGTTCARAELQTNGIPVVWITGVPGYFALTHVEPVPHQPDGIEELDDKTMPEASRAAERVLAYVSEFGDGLYDVAGGAPLYGRDLEILARVAQRSAGATR